MMSMDHIQTEDRIQIRAERETVRSRFGTAGRAAGCTFNWVK